MRVLGLDNVFVEVGDLDEAVQFYQDRLGLPVGKRFEEMRMALLHVGDETPGLGVGAVEAPRAGGQKVWLEVADARGGPLRSWRSRESVHSPRRSRSPQGGRSRSRTPGGT
jgi:catechol 2,3-dioxygenase-like lactoylglutathione lyase family enzyme